MIFAGFSSALWLVLGFGWKIRVIKGKPAISVEIVGELILKVKYWYSKFFLVQRIFSTDTKS